MPKVESQRRAIVIGSSGGIGAALTKALAAEGYDVTPLSRSGVDGEPIDLANEASIAAAANRLAGQAPFSAILVSTGLLHGPAVIPEKSLKDIDPDSLMRLFAVNAIGPALIAKHFVPLMPKSGRCIFAVLSARVGSIGDNRLGGWYGYRASKAALNMIIKTLAIEVARTRPEAICVGVAPRHSRYRPQQAVPARRRSGPAVHAGAVGGKSASRRRPAHTGSVRPMLRLGRERHCSLEYNAEPTRIPASRTPARDRGYAQSHRRSCGWGCAR